MKSSYNLRERPRRNLSANKLRLKPERSKWRRETGNEWPILSSNRCYEISKMSKKGLRRRPRFQTPELEKKCSWPSREKSFRRKNAKLKSRGKNSKESANSRKTNVPDKQWRKQDKSSR